MIVVPKGREEITEIILRYLTTILLLIHLVTNTRTNYSFDINQFIVTNLFVLTLVQGLSKKLLTIVLLCFAVMAIALNDLTISVLVIPFLILPLLHEKLRVRDFSIYCLACIVILGRFGSDQINISLIGFVILSSFICIGEKMRIKEKVVL
jgi:Na+/H+ antiporter NhaD/arsenite permease-like protein